MSSLPIDGRGFTAPAHPEFGQETVYVVLDRGYGDAWPYMLLAEGRLEVVAEFDVREYDIAAHVPIVLEAGGRFTDIDGMETLSARSSLASNGLLHETVLETLRA